MMTTQQLLLAALVGAVAGVAANVVLSSIRRAFNDWRLRRARVCPACRGHRMLNGSVAIRDDESSRTPVEIPCPLCNPRGKHPRVEARKP